MKKQMRAIARFVQNIIAFLPYLESKNVDTKTVKKLKTPIYAVTICGVKLSLSNLAAI